jgi:hypothetical protein
MELVAISVREVYSDVCNSLFEPGGLTGQIVSDDMFLRLLNDSIRNILQASNCFVKLNNIPTALGVGIYDHPWYINQTLAATCDESNLYQGSGHYWDNSDYRWQQLGPATPEEFRTDQLQEDQIEIRPEPAWNGYFTFYESGMYGTFSETSDALTFDIDYDPASIGMYGTIGKTDLGQVYTEFTSPMYGIPATITESTLNITEFDTYTPSEEIESLDGYIPDLPASFKPYVKFAVLSAIYSMDGESKNETLTKYYKNRLNELFRLLRSVAGEVLLQTT